MVSQPLLEELKNIIKDECGRDLEMQDVARIAEDMVGYFDLLAKINYRRRQSHAERKVVNKGKTGEKPAKTRPSLAGENTLLC